MGEPIQSRSSQGYEIPVFSALLIHDPKPSLQMCSSIKTIKMIQKRKNKYILAVS